MERTQGWRRIDGAIHDNLTSILPKLLSVCFVLAVSLQCNAADPARMSLKRSEVVFPRSASPEVYQQYGATLVAWGFRSWNLTGQELTSQWRRQRDLAHDAGAKYQARVELDAGWRGWIDFDPKIEDSVCRTIEGKLLTYPFWTATYKGKPAYFGCTNSKGYQRYLLHQAREALSSNPDMLMIDAMVVTTKAMRGGGCFCDACVEGFREHVRKNVSPDELAKHGINDVSTFNYGDLLRKRGVTDAQFAKQVYNNSSGSLRDPTPAAQAVTPAAQAPTSTDRTLDRRSDPRQSKTGTLPLAQEYRTFQHVAARRFIEDFRQQAESLAGHRLVLSTNSFLRSPGDWWAVPAVDFFTSESAMNAKSRAIPREPIFRYKLADALNVRIVSTGTPKQDWVFVRDNHLSGLVRTWIAQAYAYGHHFMVPHSMWCGEGQEQSDYKSQPGDCDDLYQFVRKHAELFDGFATVADVGVIYSNTAFRRGQRQAQQACYELTKRNIPFRLIVAGDEWMPVKLRRESLDGLKAIIVTNPATIDSDQRTTLSAVKDRTVRRLDDGRLSQLAPPPIHVAGATNVTVLPRAKPGDDRTLVCHLLNGNYLPQSDSMQPLRNFTITLDNSLLPANVIAATLMAPGQEDVACSFTQNENSVSISVPSLDLWAMLKLEM